MSKLSGRRETVSIHAPAGGATSESNITYNNALVSIHAPAGGATYYYYYLLSMGMFQSTRLREARQALKI